MSTNHEHCGICGSGINENEEKVYCPDCGTPMHRECWDRKHCCPNAEKHGSGFAWSEPSANAERKPYEPVRDGIPVCDICGKPLNAGDRITVCPDCGTPMHYSCWEQTRHCPNEERHAEDYDWQEDHPTLLSGVAPRTYDGFDTIGDEILRNPVRSRETGEALTCSGVTQKELISFLGKDCFSTPRFFSMFLSMANSKRKVSLNFAAALFMPLYQFYRRMFGPALILTIANVILSIPQFIIMMKESFGAAETLDPQILQLAVILSYVDMAIKLILLLFGDFIYMKWSISKIISIRGRCAELSEDEYYEVLERSGRPRALNILLGIIIMTALVYAVAILL